MLFSFETDTRGLRFFESASSIDFRSLEVGTENDRCVLNRTRAFFSFTPDVFDSILDLEAGTDEER